MPSSSPSIDWLVPQQVENLTCIKNSDIASIRLRLAIAAHEANKYGIYNEFSDGKNFDVPTILFVGKLEFRNDRYRADRWLSRLKKCAEYGAKIVIDYADNHLYNQSGTAEFYKAALQYASEVICSSPILATYVRNFYFGPITVIEDPVEVPIQKPKIKIASEPRVLWFGDSDNLSYLIDFLKNDYQAGKRINLLMITNLAKARKKVNEIKNLRKPHNLEIDVFDWNLADFLKIASHADMCWIPAGLNDENKRGASSNRLLTALALGLPTAADHLESYAPFNNFYKGLRDGNPLSPLNNLKKSKKLIIDAQKKISRDFSKKSIGDQWIKVINKIINSKKSEKLISTYHPQIFRVNDKQFDSNLIQDGIKNFSLI